jgi:predicted AAA+ superfamily ATPase
MVIRTLAKKAKSLAKQYPVLLITGPRQSGKTTLCRAVFADKPYISFENLDIREMAQKDPRGFLGRYPDGAIFDEIQRCPDLLSYMQGIVDEKQKNGMYIITGSQNILLLKTVQQSLAGRMAILKLLPFSMIELKSLTALPALDQLLYKGFFPRIYDKKLNPTEAMSNYFSSYVERDVRNIIDVKNISLFQKFLKLCAARTGQILNLSGIGNDLGVSHSTVREWLSVLEASYIIFLLPAYYRNLNKRLVKSPKIYFYDVGMAAYLLGIERVEHLSRDPLRGNLFENLVLIEILKSFFNAGRNAPLYFFRDHTGNEVDILIEQAGNVTGFEVKSGQTIDLGWFKGLNYLKKIMSKYFRAGALVYGGKESHGYKDGNIFSYQDIEKIFALLG